MEISNIISSQNLNSAQAEAIGTIYGPVLVVAGPGTGKTQMLSLRIVNILANTDADASNILCLTFTESGANEMRNRLRKFIGNEAYKIGIYTFHGLCNEIISTHSDKFSFTKNLVQLDSLSAIKLLRKIVDEWPKEITSDLIPLANRYKYIDEILRKISVLKREKVDPNELSQRAKEYLIEYEANPIIGPKSKQPTKDWRDNLKKIKKTVDFAAIYKRYTELMVEEGFYDYEDMLLFVISAFEKDDELLAEYQERYQYILVDEFQDTNGAQSKILQFLTSFDKSPNLFAVGDDDQAIYRFQGANVQNILEYSKQYEGVKTITVTENFRSSQSILDLADNLIANNKERLVNLMDIKKKLTRAKSSSMSEKKPIYCEFEHGDYENKYIIEKIKNLLAQGVDPSSIAILYRKHAEGEELAELLIKNDIPIKLMAGRDAMNEPVVLQFIDLLNVVSFSIQDDDSTLYSVLSQPFFGISELDLFRLSRFLNSTKYNTTENRRKKKLIDIISSKEEIEKAEVENAEKLFNISEKIVSWHNLSKRENVFSLIETILTESGFLAKNFGNENEKLEPLNSFLSFYEFVKSQVRLNKNLKLDELLRDLELMRTSGTGIAEKELDTLNSGVNLITVHGAKGMQFGHVFVIHLTDGSWGKSRNNDQVSLYKEIVFPDMPENTKESDIEDARRLLFVAVTRAVEGLYLTYSKKYSNTDTEYSESHFIAELDKNLYDKEDTSVIQKIDPEFAIKSMVKHVPESKEEKILKELVADFKLSATSLNEYIKCPLNFKYKYVVKVPSGFERPLVLGSAIHFAMEAWGNSKLKNEPFGLNDLLSAYRFKLDKEILSEEQYEELILEGNNILSRYYEEYKTEVVLPLKVEYSFSNKNIYFAAEGMEPIQLVGKIDRIDLMDKNSATVRIVDYKTKRPETLNEVKGATKNSDGSTYRQLLFYKLLCDLDESLRDSKGQRYRIEEMVLDYFKEKDKKLERLSLMPSQEDLNAFKELITKAVNSIRNLQFYDTEDFPLCGECEYCKATKSQ